MTKRDQAFYLKASFWAQVLAVVVPIGIAVFQWQDARSAREELDFAQANVLIARGIAESAKATQRAQAQQLEITDKANLATFLDLYAAYVRELEDAITRYKSEPTADNESQVYVHAQALRDFVNDWRRIQSQLAELLDGNVDRLESAIQLEKVKDIEVSLKLIQLTFQSKRPLLEKEIENQNR
jgi:hypothetical protein